MSTPLAQDICGAPIGSNSSDSFLTSEARRFYLNMAKPALCNGSVSSLEYCYYGPSTFRRIRRSFIATVAIYRQSSERSSYERVSDTITISKQRPSIQVHPSEAIRLGFNCDSFMLNADIHVQEGDVIGACLFNPGFRSQELLLVSQNSSNGYLMLYQESSTARCGVDVLPNLVSESDLVQDDVLKVLHVSAVISKISQCCFETVSIILILNAFSSFATIHSPILYRNTNGKCISYYQSINEYLQYSCRHNMLQLIEHTC